MNKSEKTEVKPLARKVRKKMAEPMPAKEPTAGTGQAQESGKTKSLLVFFLSCFKISAVTFGGGYVIVPLQKRRFSDELGWLDEEEVLDLVALAQSAPGPVAINASVLMGQRLFGLKGAILAVLGTVLPPLMILSLISLFYQAFSANRLVRAFLKGMQASVAALIFSAIWDMTAGVLKKRSLYQLALLILALALVFLTEVNIVLILLLCALLGWLSLFMKKDPTEEARPQPTTKADQDKNDTKPLSSCASYDKEER